MLKKGRGRPPLSLFKQFVIRRVGIEISEARELTKISKAFGQRMTCSVGIRIDSGVISHCKEGEIA